MTEASTQHASRPREIVPVSGCRKHTGHTRGFAPSADPKFSIFRVFRGFRSVFRVFRGRGGRGRLGTYFRAPGSIFHARESNFHARNRFFVPKTRFLLPEDCFSCVFGLFSWSGRVRAGPRTYFPAQAWIFHTQESIFHAQNLIFMLGDAWGLVLSCLVLSCLVLS